jgi:hypothetical protein
VGRARAREPRTNGPSVRPTSPVSVSHSLMAPSDEPVSIVRPSGTAATVRTAAEWPRKVRTTCARTGSGMNGQPQPQHKPPQ